jgi:hypothetical protein
MTFIASLRFLPCTLAVVALSALLAACGGGEQEQTAAGGKKAVDKPAAAAAKSPVKDDGPDSLKANAVATGKTAAAVDLKYDVLARPDPGQDFQIELVFLPRVAADSLEVEVTGIPGVAIVSGGTARFENVMAGERYPAPVVARADGPGLYYLGVSARMVNKVQTEARTFSVPVVVGAVAAAEKPTPATDAEGQAVESMPAAETGRETE